MSEFPNLMRIKPKESYVFKSNHYSCDGNYFAVLSFFHNDGSIDDFPTFWGIDLIPSGLDDEISVINIKTVERMSDGWVREHQAQAENVAQMNTTEQSNPGSSIMNRLKAEKQSELIVKKADFAKSAGIYL